MIHIEWSYIWYCMLQRVVSHDISHFPHSVHSWWTSTQIIVTTIHYLKVHSIPARARNIFYGSLYACSKSLWILWLLPKSYISCLTKDRHSDRFLVNVEIPCTRQWVIIVCIDSTNTLLLLAEIKTSPIWLCYKSLQAQEVFVRNLHITIVKELHFQNETYMQRCHMLVYRESLSNFLWWFTPRLYLRGGFEGLLRRFPQHWNLTGDWLHLVSSKIIIIEYFLYFKTLKSCKIPTVFDYTDFGRADSFIDCTFVR